MMAAEEAVLAATLAQIEAAANDDSNEYGALHSYAYDNLAITQEEKDQALAVKAALAAAEADQDDDNETRTSLHASDFEIVLQVLIHGSNVTQIIENLQQLQTFRCEYEANDTLDEAVDFVNQVFEQQRGVILHSDYCPAIDRVVVVNNRAAFDKRKMAASTRSIRVVFLGSYYLMHSNTPDFHIARRGLVLLSECHNMSWKQLPLQFIQDIWSYLVVPSPLNHVQIFYYHTRMAANLTYALLKPFLPARIRNKIKLGCQAPAFLSELFLAGASSQQQLNQRIMTRTKLSLTARFANAKAFSLDEATILPEPEPRPDPAQE